MVKTSTRIVGALALVSALAGSSAALAAQPGAGLEGDLNQLRTSADVVIPVDCDAVTGTQTKTASVSVKIYQSVGRLLNIGTGSGVPTCTGQPEPVVMTVNAIQGLKFQPGPATILITLKETITTTTPNPDPLNPTPVVTVTTTETETGAKINLRP